MDADPDSLIIAKTWRKSTRSGHSGCVEAMVVTALHPQLTVTPAPGLGSSNLRPRDT